MLPGGLQINGNHASRLFEVSMGRVVKLHCLTLTNGFLGASIGGAVYNNGGSLTLTHCTVAGNSANYCGALYNNAGTLTLTNCTLSGNVANLDGGAIYSFRGTLALNNCTLSDNSAGGTPKAERYLPAYLDRAQIDVLFQMVEARAASGRFIDVRNAAILELFYSTGMRLSELQGLNRQDIGDCHHFDGDVIGHEIYQDWLLILVAKISWQTCS